MLCGLTRDMGIGADHSYNVKRGHASTCRTAVAAASTCRRHFGNVEALRLAHFVEVGLAGLAHVILQQLAVSQLTV